MFFSQTLWPGWGLLTGDLLTGTSWKVLEPRGRVPHRDDPEVDVLGLQWVGAGALQDGKVPVVLLHRLVDAAHGLHGLHPAGDHHGTSCREGGGRRGTRTLCNRKKLTSSSTSASAENPRRTLRNISVPGAVHLSWPSSPGRGSCWCLRNPLWRKARWARGGTLLPSRDGGASGQTKNKSKSKGPRRSARVSDAVLTSSIPEAVKKMPTSSAYFCSSLYCWWLNSRWRLCSP